MTAALFQCPTCQRAFVENGYCPYDRAALVSLRAGQSTQLSMAMPSVQSAQISAQLPAQQPPGSPTIVQPQTGGPHRTFQHAGGATPSKPATSEITNARGQVPQPIVKPPSSQQPAQPIRSLSASHSSENPQEVLDAVRGARDNEYDRLVGQTLDGRYYVERKIGEGGMGVVFAARHAVIERPLAIKVLKREVMRDTATIRRFVQEAKAASRIGHPNIVDVTDFGTTPDGMTYSVMEYITGTTLGGAIRAGAPMAVHRMMRIAAQIARALGAAHDKGIVHRDLKPENVFLVDRDGRIDFVKIVDFGIAKVAPVDGQQEGPRLTRAGSVFGTPEYMAPEQAAGRSDTDGRVDIYALGVIMYEMLVGRVPHKGDTMVRTLAMQMLDPVEPPSKVRPDLGIPPEVEAVVLAALTKKREQRYQKMGDLLAALEAVQKQIGPPPVGISVTGSPVYALAPLPPGADASVSPVLPPMPLDLRRGPQTPQSITSQLAAQQQQPQTHSGRSKAPTNEVIPAGGRSRQPTNQPITSRPKDEPQFVTSEKAISFEHLYTDEHQTHAQAPPKRRWPLLLMLGLVVGGGVGGVMYAVTRHDAKVIAAEGPKDASGPGSASGSGSGSAVIAMTTVDAGGEIAQPGSGTGSSGEPVGPNPQLVVDAGTQIAATTPHDANDLFVIPDAYVRPRAPVDGGAPQTGPITQPDPISHKGFVQVRVVTNVDTAQIFVGTSYRGPNNITLEELSGKHVTIECRHAGYKSGFVTIAFDGKTTDVVCQLTRIKTCVGAGSGVGALKNPFDQCPEDAN